MGRGGRVDYGFQVVCIFICVQLEKMFARYETKNVM